MIRLVGKGFGINVAHLRHTSRQWRRYRVISIHNGITIGVLHRFHSHFGISLGSQIMHCTKKSSGFVVSFPLTVFSYFLLFFFIVSLFSFFALLTCIYAEYILIYLHLQLHLICIYCGVSFFYFLDFFVYDFCNYY